MDLPPFTRVARSTARFLIDTRGGMAERWAMIAGAICVGCVAGANVAATVAKQGMLPEIVWHTGSERQMAKATPSSSAPGTIDYTVTASIASPSAVTRLDPCTGRAK